MKLIQILCFSLLATLPLAAGERIRTVLFPFREAVISARVDSVLQPYSFRIGQSFKNGEVIVSLADDRFRLEFQRASEKHKFDQASFEDQQRLRERNLTSDYLLKKAEFERNMSAVVLREAQLNLSYCRITAPFDGKIVEVMTREYETVRPGQPICRIIDDNTLLAVMNVPMHNRDLTTVGQTVRVKLDSGKVVAGEIYEVSPQADHRTGTIRIRVRIDNRDGALTAGATGELYDGE